MAAVLAFLKRRAVRLALAALLAAAGTAAATGHFDITALAQALAAAFTQPPALPLP